MHEIDWTRGNWRRKEKRLLSSCFQFLRGQYFVMRFHFKLDAPWRKTGALCSQSRFNVRTGKSRLLAISLAAVFIILSSSSGSMVRNCLDRSSLTGVHGKSKRPSPREVGLPSASLTSRSNMDVRLGDSGKLVRRARPRAASKSDISESKIKRVNYRKRAFQLSHFF